MDKYKKILQIGYGGCGDVYKGCNSATDKAVTLKELWFPYEREGVPGIVIREISLLKELEHNNIVRLLDVVIAEDKDSLYLVYESMDLDLKNFMDTYPEIAKDPDVIKRYLQQILRAVAYYHSHNIIHQDVKPRNLLIDRHNSTLKLADFGWARAFGGFFEACCEEDVILSYKAPEVLLGCKQYSTNVDVWSVGCIFAEMVIQKPLFPAHTKLHQLAKIFSIMGTPTEDTWPGVSSSCPSVSCYSKRNPKELADVVPGLEPAGVDLLSRMLCMTPSGRITARDALKHVYFEGLGFEP